MLDVLHVVPDLLIGGAERVICNLSAEQRRRGMTVEVVSLWPSSGSPMEMQLEAAGVPVTFLGKAPGLDLRAFGRLGKLVSARRPNVLHSHRYAVRYSIPGSRDARVRVHTVHSRPAFEVSKYDRLLLRRCYRRGSILPVCLSTALAAEFVELYGVEPFIAPNGVWITAEVERRTMPRRHMDFIQVGRLAPEKRVDLAIRAIAELSNAGHEPTLRIVGEGPLRATLEELAVKLAVSHRVRFLGSTDDINQYLADATALVLPSDYEGLPMAALEAMASDVPVVATRVGGVPELLGNGRYGYLVDKGDAVCLADALIEVARDPEAADAKASLARSAVKEVYSIRAMADAYESVYASI